jgi:hypothetical protein
MANPVDLLKSDLSKGVAIGLSLGAIGMGLAPVLRPVAKRAVKSGILILDKGRAWVFEACDSLEEIVAGVRVKLTQEGLDQDGAGGGAASDKRSE